MANFVAEDCNYILKKLISIVDLLSETLTILVLPLPKGATNLDTYYARTLCKLFHHRGRELNIFFIKSESKQELITKVFKREKKILKSITSVQVSLDFSEGTLLYAWGSSRRGKLGLGQSLAELRGNSQFVTECRSICA